MPTDRTPDSLPQVRKRLDELAVVRRARPLSEDEMEEYLTLGLLERRLLARDRRASHRDIHAG